MNKGLKEKIILLRKEGLTIKEIVEELHCSKSTISYHINKIGLGGKRNRFLNGVNDETINLIKDLRLKKVSYGEILKKVNISEDRLKKISNLLDLNKPISGFFNRKILNKDEVIAFYLENKSLNKTAKFFKCCKTTIRKIIPTEIILSNKKIGCLGDEKKRKKSLCVVNWRKRKKVELVNYKGGECVCCGYNKSISALQFHHLNPKEKDFSISGKSYSFEKLKREVDKCILVCSNCHIEIHEQIKNFGFSEKINKTGF